MSWDLWVDFQRTGCDGVTHATTRHARPGAVLEPGRFILVGNEDADLAVAEILSIDNAGIVLVRVLPGAAEDHLSLLDARTAG